MRLVPFADINYVKGKMVLRWTSSVLVAGSLLEFKSTLTKYELYQPNDTKQQNKQNSLKRPLTGKPHSGFLFNCYYC